MWFTSAPALASSPGPASVSCPWPCFPGDLDLDLVSASYVRGAIEIVGEATCPAGFRVKRLNGATSVQITQRGRSAFLSFDREVACTGQPDEFTVRFSNTTSDSHFKPNTATQVSILLTVRTDEPFSDAIAELRQNVIVDPVSIVFVGGNYSRGAVELQAEVTCPPGYRPLRRQGTVWTYARIEQFDSTSSFMAVSDTTSFNRQISCTGEPAPIVLRFRWNEDHTLQFQPDVPTRYALGLSVRSDEPHSEIYAWEDGHFTPSA